MIIDYGSWKTADQTSGFFDLPGYQIHNQICRNPSHYPPISIYIPEGKGYRHVCPGCGNVSVLTNRGRW